MILRPAFLALATLLAFGRGAVALPLVLPEPAEVGGTRAEALGSYAMPIGPFAQGRFPTVVTEGMLDQTAWHVGAPGLTTLQLLAPLRAQLAAAGFTILFECETDACGGFDFRYGLQVLPEPAMHVDLGDFRFLAARRDGAGAAEHVSLLVSRSASRGYVQITRTGPDPGASPTVAALPATLAPDAPPLSAAAQQGPGPLLQSQGHAGLEGLAFAPGSATLTGEDFPDLAALAEWLELTPSARVVLVGHTDASGQLASNIALSRERAMSVRRVLIDRFGVPANRVSAEGVGPLSPRASNLTEEGRTRNRRVEVILTSTK